MALTRNLLKSLGLTEEQVGTIIEAHTETVDGLKERLKVAEEKASKADDLQKKLDGLEAKATGSGEYKARAENAEKALEEYKRQVAAEKDKAAKESAAKSFFEKHNITGANLAIALRGAKDEISALELDENGNIKDSKSLDDLIDGEFAGLVVKSSIRGARTATPPGSGSSHAAKTKKEIMEIKDTGERQKAWAEYLAAQQQ